MKDDYKEEYLARLSKSLLYSTLKNNCKDKDNEVISLVDSLVSYSVQRTKTIIRHMGEFTLHDSDHLFRVLYLMEKLLPKEVIANLSTPELLLLIASAFMHDVGMAPNEEEVLTWRKLWDVNPTVNDEELETFNNFKRYYYSRPDQIEVITKLVSQGKNSQADIIKAYVVTEYIRRTHAERIKDVIEKDWNDKIKYRDNDLTVELAQICLSHNEDALTLLEFDKFLICGENTYICLPLIGIILRLSDILDFDAKRTPSILYSHLYVREPISIKEWSKHRSIESWEINSENIYFTAKCSHPAIEASIHQFCDYIDHELSICNNIISELNEFHAIKRKEIFLKIPYKVSREKITTKRNVHNKPIYIYKDTQFNLSKRQVIELLMGTKLYGNPEIALRELVQNSIDACLLRQAQEKKWGNLFQPEITIKYVNEDGEKILIVEDNGTGMDQYIIDNYYSKVGSSFYKSTDFYNLLSETNAEFIPTSRFGIGILSCFMVADTLIVNTKRVYAEHQSSEPLNLTVEGQDSIFWIKEGDRSLPGTTTKLILRDYKNPWKKMDDNRFIKSVKNMIPNPPFNIKIITETESSLLDESNFESLTPTSLIESYYWKEHPNVKYFDVNLNSPNSGIKGMAQIAILETKGMPKREMYFDPTTINIDGEDFTLDKKLWAKDKRIDEESTSITVDDNYGINSHNSFNILAKSKAKVSLHGIEIPCNLFPDSWDKKENQATISFPFPIALIVDICGRRDLDLNSSRTEIIISDKWYDFEEKLAYLICKEISECTQRKYWNKFKKLCTNSSKNEIFLKAISLIPER
jgi:molecular chaperone HtpG